MSFGGGGTVPGVKAPNINFQPVNFNSGGLSGYFSGQGSGGSNGQGVFGGGGFTLGESGQLGTAVRGVQNAFSDEANALGGLLDTVQPGFSQFRQQGLNDIENQRQQAVSNLTDNLSKRRVLGSSFANSAASETNADFASSRANFIAQSYLQELSASNQLTQEKFGAVAQGFATQVQQLNFESGIAAQMSSQVTQSYAQLSSAEAQMQLQSQEFNAQLQVQQQEFQQQMMMQMLGMGLSLFGSFGGGGGGI